MLSFIIIQLPPGDYVTSYIAQMAASGQLVSQEEAENLRQQYGLDQPIYVQYMRWIGQVLHGDFGMAMEWRRPVIEVIGDRLALTIVLSFAAVVFTWVLALPIGIYSAVRQYSIGDYIFTIHRLHRPGGAELPAGADPDVLRLSLLRHERRRPLLRRVHRRALELGQVSGT